MILNRRQAMAGAMALFGQAHLPSAFVAQSVGSTNNVSTSNIGAPSNLLTTSFSPELLSRSLLSATSWHPYPRVDERDVWLKVPRDISNFFVQRANAIRGTEWSSLPATIFLEFKRTGNRSDYEHLLSTRRQRLEDLVMGECFEGEGRFLDEIANGVWLTCEETYWGLPAHLSMQKDGPGLPDVTEPIVDLVAGETGATISWIDYLVGTQLDQVSPLIRSRMRIEAKRRILDPAFERNDFWWMGLDGKHGMLNNWNPWINSNWLMANLLLEQDSSRRLRAVSKICNSLDQYLAQYSPDGGCVEGPAYWTMSAAAFFDCCVLLASVTGGAATVLTNPFIRKMGHYIADVHIADDYYVNYGDAHAKGNPPPGLVFRFGSGVEDKVLEAFGASIAAQEGEKSLGPGSISRALPDILSATTIRNTQKEDALERDSWYPSLHLMTAREKAGSSDGFYLAVQAANNNRSHGHNDSGSFIVFHDGEPVFIDVGVEAYTAKTFGPDRYSIWTMQSAYHNLPTVGGVMQQYKGYASDVHYDSDDARASISMNLATAYPAEAGIRHWLRKMTLDRKAGRVYLTENFNLQKKVPVVLSLMTSRVPSLSTKGRIVLSSIDKSVRDVSLKYDSSSVTPKFERIVLKDEGMRRTWGENIYRVLLATTELTDSGRWLFEVS